MAGTDIKGFYLMQIRLRDSNYREPYIKKSPEAASKVSGKEPPDGSLQSVLVWE